MDEENIEAFLREMQESHTAEIDSVMLPEGTREYVQSRVREGDIETLLFMLRLGYLMGLQTGYAVAQNGQDISSGLEGSGPLQA